MNKRSDFEWDSTKDALNQEKHGVSLLSWIIIVSFLRIWSTAMLKNDFTVLAGSPTGL